MNENLTLSFPNNLITEVRSGDFRLLTDYPVERGGYNVALNPWKLFLSALPSCHGVNLAKYCQANGLDYQKIKLELKALTKDNKRDEFPEYQIHVTLPDDFPAAHIRPMIEFFTDCPVSNHLTELKPVIKTFINRCLVKQKRR